MSKWKPLLGGLLSVSMLSIGAYAVAQPLHDPVVTNGGEDVSSRHIVLPLGKSAIVELPRDAVDILVSNPAVVNPVIRTPRRVYVTAKAPGMTNAFFFDRNNNQILNLEIRVEQDAKALEQLIRKLLPDSRISVESINGSLVLYGTVDTPQQAQQAEDIAGRFGVLKGEAGGGDEDKKGITSMITIREPSQVMLRVRIVEMQRRLVRQLGIDLDGVARINDTAVSFAVDNSFAISGAPLGGIGGEINTPGFGDIDNLDFAFDAFEQNGLVKTLAEPNLTAISGYEANFLAGGEFPVPEASALGVPSITFKEFGVKLGFMPIVYSKNRIQLRLETEVSELSPTNGLSVASSQTVDEQGNVIEQDGFIVPGITTRNAQTTIELPSGGSIAIAGLLQENIADFFDGVPGLKDTPVLGTLFRSQEFQNEQTELVIIATPYLVEPTNPANLTDPVKGHISPTVLESFLLGKLEAAYGVKNSGVDEQTVQGPLGFILD